jgi:hypothetical protein
MAMPEQISTAKGNTMIQRSELATIRRGSMNIAFISFFHLPTGISAVVAFRATSGPDLLW